MFRTIALTLALSATPVLAANHGQGGGMPGAHFIENWDLDEDGQITLAEVIEKREDLFYAFDSDENGVLDAEEHDMFDEVRATDLAENGQGMGQGRDNPANGMLREVTDANGDGLVSHQEFMEAVPDWFARMDRNGDGVVTTDDFGPRRG